MAGIFESNYFTLFQIIGLFFTPVLFVPALISLIVYVMYHRCRRCCRPWARAVDMPWTDPWAHRLDLSSPKSVWSGLTTSATLSQSPRSAHELFSRDPEVLRGLRDLLGNEVRAAFGRLSDSFENPSFIPVSANSSTAAVVIEPGSGKINVGAEENNSEELQQEF